MTTNNLFQDCDIISTYTRKQAIDDGELIDVSETAKEAGFIYPVAITRNLWHTWIIPNKDARQHGQDAAGRLWDVLWMLKVAIRKSTGEHITYQVIFQDGPARNQYHEITLWVICGPGDDAEPVVTIMLPEDY